VGAAARPLIRKANTDERQISRTFECFDHKHDGVEGFVTISGGKTTTARGMAEKVSDVVCAKLGHRAECRTKETPLLSYRLFYN
jgi:glycerol-3-phosphate dehydrogenase